MHPFRHFINNYVSLSENDWKEIAVFVQKENLPKGAVILEEGKVCRHLYFLESGLLRFFVWRDGRDISKFFTLPPYCLTSQRSFNQQEPAKENIETLEDSVLYKMKRADVLSLIEQNLRWNQFARKLTQEVQFFTEQIYEDLQNLTAEERYKKLIETGSPLVNRVPLKHLASFLGIAPQSISRIRKKITQ